MELFMKRLISLITSLVVLAAPLFAMVKTSALGPNLVANPSVETVNTSNTALPQSWQKNKWGTNSTTFTYVKNAGRTGTKSVKAQVTSYTSGDAKWYFNPVAVQPNQTYTFSDYYKASIPTEVIVQVENTAGALSYYTVGTPTASSTTWKAFSVNFTTPANAKKATVFHVIKKVGWLQLDDAYFGLGDNPATPPAVSLTGPAAGTTVSGTVALSANASDDKGVAGVQFKVDGTNVGTEDTTAPYSVNWNTTTVANGAHAITAVARNINGLSTTSSPTQVTVNNATAPTVSITSPANGATVTETQNITAAAASPGASVAGVQFKLDGANLGAEDTTGPYEFSWDTHTATPGTHTLTAVVRSTNGLTATSAPVTVTVEDEHEHNIIPNASVETVDPTNSQEPLAWNHNSWGGNTPVFTYDQTGHTGGRSVTTQITTYTDGDAKWFFEPVTVTAGKTYLYRDFYKANVPTRVVAAFVDASGNYTYQELNGAAAANNWTQYQASFTVPATATKVTVFHLIDRVGSLSLDDVLLEVAVSTTPDTIPNGSLELGGTAPTGWTGSNWGTNTANFEYITNEGHTGNRSAKVTVSNYQSGDAKWFFDPINTLTPGKQYRFTTWYKTNITPHAVVLFIDANGVERYVGMTDPLPNGSADWQKYSDTFMVPQGTVSVSVFLFVNQNGWLQTDDYSITDYSPNGFSRPLVTLTFDDGHEDNHTTALPIMGQYGFKSTQCYATSFIEGNAQAVQNVLAFKNAGHEICSHTVTHPFLTTLNDADLDYELRHSKEYLESIIGGPVRNFASPYGDYDARVNAVIDNYYQSHRSVDEGFNSKDNFDIYRLRVQNILDTTTAAQVAAWIEQAKADNTWLILVYHRVAANPGPYDSYTNVFAEHMAAIAASGVTVKTYNDALGEVLPQL
jgi:peptidoglycan/xylan/chitin deacetylase (PgdA/CDA1 family)